MTQSKGQHNFFNCHLCSNPLLYTIAFIRTVGGVCVCVCFLCVCVWGGGGGEKGLTYLGKFTKLLTVL